MPTPIELLEKKIRSREDVLRARRVEGLAREEEVEELKESLQKLQSTRKGIHKAIGDVLSEDPAADPIAPTDLIEMAVEGCGKGSSDNSATATSTTENTFPEENMTAEEAVNLALLSMKQDLGTVDFVEYIISTAVELSGLDGEDVVKAALDTTRSSRLKAEDVILAALRSSRDSRFVHAPQIMGAAVQIALRRDIEAPVIVKEAFVKAVRGDHSLIKSSILSLLGCAVGMGMGYRDVKGLVKAFSKEIKHGQMGQDGTSGMFSLDSVTHPCHCLIKPSLLLPLPPSLGFGPLHTKYRRLFPFTAQTGGLAILDRTFI